MLNIVAYVRFYPPHSNCGSDRYLHDLLKILQERGHRVLVMLGQDAKGCPYNYDGIQVIRREGYGLPYLAKADVVFTHLDFTAECANLIRTKPIVWFMHNLNIYSTVVRCKDQMTVVYNSEAALKQINYPNKKLVLYPPTPVSWYDVSSELRKDWNPAEGYIMLINLTENKGQKLFYALAEMMPDFKFLGIKGGYGTQVIKELPNVRIIDNTDDIREVYSITSFLLVPSEKESWGRVATEAAANGIPVLSSKTPGLFENMGEAGTYLNIKEPKTWETMIRQLSGKKEYQDQSARVRKRAIEIDEKNKEKIDILEDTLYKLAKKPKPVSKNEIH